MLGKLSKKITIAVLVSIFVLTGTTLQASQDQPEIPDQISFGGITVRLDRGAQSLIEEDVRSLMSNKKYWEEKMDRALLYFPIVESILMDEEVPLDFKYLAVQESSFKPDVISTSNAVGYWQFKPETAAGLNLRIDAGVDERKNISSSTHAAAWYLKKNYSQFNNWVTTLYSYYLGAGGVKKVVPSNWAYAREISLTGKSDRYMLRFFAHKIALEAGIEKYRSNNRFILMESDYGKGRSMDEIARNLDLNADDLKSHNRWLNEDKVPADGDYMLLLPIPLDRIEATRQKLTIQVEPIKNHITRNDNGYPILKKSAIQSPDKNAPTLYEINGLPGIEARPGDRPKVLAKAGNIKTPTFLKNNDMVRDMPLIPGRVYYLARKNKRAATPYHTAQPGDTWQSVSQQYGVRLVSLLKYNRTISRNFPIEAGQVLWLTEKRPRKIPAELKPVDTPQKPTPVADPPIAVAETNKETTAATSYTTTNQSSSKPSSGRKKYTPVLVDKSANSEIPETRPATAPEAPKSDGKENLYRNSKDRVVVISPDSNNGNASKVTDKKTPSVPVKTTPVTTTVSSSVTQPGETSTFTSSDPSGEFHVVEKGQTYFAISKMNNISVRELLNLNNLSENEKLSVGQRLRVRKQAATSATSNGGTPAAAASASAPPSTHTVATGENLYRISKTYEVDIEDLKALNNLSGNSLQLGQKLKIPQKK
jgi:membrane-bound lytic murein transglycosylase D